MRSSNFVPTFEIVLDQHQGHPLNLLHLFKGGTYYLGMSGLISDHVASAVE